ncbi:MAG: sigma-E processing peptidase SpoIIGA [Clostridia bacterium]|nr:sigma-E processing peptidase SpoIIGA [Clostridia bacterium]
MTVYIEYVLLDNLIIDYLLLKATFAITGKIVSRGRLFLCALLGAVVALLYPLLEVSLIISTTVKILAGMLIVLIASNYRRAKEFYVCAVIFFTLTFLTGGAITGIFSILNLPPSSEISVALMFLPVYLVIRMVLSVVKYIYRKKHVAGLIYKAELHLYDKFVSSLAFMDTGNCLTDGLSPMIVVSKKVFSKLVGDNICKLKVKEIEIDTIGGKTKTLSFKIERLVLYFSDLPNIYSNVTACVAPNVIGDGYDVILHPAFMEKENKDEVDEFNKKVS